MHTDIVDNIPIGAIERSAIHGYGLFAQHVIPSGSVLASLDGLIVPWRVYKTNRDMSADGLNEWNALTPDMLLVRPIRTKYSFINHSRAPNCKIVNLANRLQVLAMTFIPCREELTLDYRLEPLPPEYRSGPGGKYL